MECIGRKLACDNTIPCRHCSAKRVVASSEEQATIPPLLPPTQELNPNPNQGQTTSNEIPEPPPDAPDVQHKKRIPYIPRLPYGASHHKIPSEAVVEDRSRSPNRALPVQEMTSTSVQSRKEVKREAIKLNWGNVEDVKTVYAREAMEGVKIVDFAFNIGARKRTDPCAWNLRLCGGPKEKMWVEDVGSEIWLRKP
ncbi:hypothetical protein BT69DRAFT_431652 [Atractiella rhizophila]|nr:hypothetical protein BT69DRAFT_431652 [Atractiella rhizophila]